MGWNRLGCTGLDWEELGWTGLEWVGLGWTGLNFLATGPSHRWTLGGTVAAKVLG